MISNHIKTGWRNFTKHKTYSFINLFGLSVGFTSALLLFLIVDYENSFDDFHSRSANIYRVGNKHPNGNQDDRVVVPQAALMDEEYPEIVASTRFFPQDYIATQDDNKFTRLVCTYVDEDFADMFDFTMIMGDMKQALSKPGHVVITAKTAAAMFGTGDPIGRTISLKGVEEQFTVAGVAANPPGNSTLQFEAVIPWSSAPEWLDIDQTGNWYNTFMESYVALDANASMNLLEEKLITFVNRHFLKERRADWRIALLPMSGEHFRLTENQKTISILAMMAGSILLISCINFANLNIAQTLGRSREIGVRRVLGSLRRQIAMQFIAESVFAFGLSLLVATGITYLVLPFVNEYYGFHITITLGNIESLSLFLLCAACLAVATTTVGTAVALTKQKPANALKGVITYAGRGERLRRALLVVQFSAAIILLIGTAIVWQQTVYMEAQDLKFKASNVVIIDAWSELFRNPEHAKQQLSTMREALANESAIKSVAFTGSAPGEYNENYNRFREIDDSTKDNGVSLRKVYMADGYFETLGMDIVMGRAFSKDIKSDTASVIINETAMREFGWTNINDKRLAEGGDGTPLRVIGVVKDYFYQSLKRPIQPLVHCYHPMANSHMAVQFNPGQVNDGLKVLEKKWEQLDSYETFSYRFLDKTFENLYKEQERLGSTASLFAVISITIAGLGLFSITAYSIRLRRKEVGIRKVLGASIMSIVVSLSRQYSMLIGIGFVIACPIVCYLTSKFLEDFAYRITLSPGIFMVAGLLVFGLSIAIIVAITSRAARANPVDALKENG